MLADVIAIIRNGVIRQSGVPAELFAHPADSWVAEFLGLQVLCPQHLRPGSPGRLKMRVGDGTLEVAANGNTIPDAAHLAFRPEDVHLEWLSGRSSILEEGIPAVVDAVVPLGPLFRIDLNGGVRFRALLLRPEFQRLGLKAGDRVVASIYPDDLILVPEGRNNAPAPGLSL